MLRMKRTTERWVGKYERMRSDREIGPARPRDPDLDVSEAY